MWFENYHTLPDSLTDTLLSYLHRLITENGENLSRELNKPEFRLRRCFKFRLGIRKSLSKVVLPVILALGDEYKNGTVSVIMYKIKGFREKLVCVIVPTFLIFMFVDQLLLVDVRSQPAVLFNLSQKTTMADFRYKSLKS